MSPGLKRFDRVVQREFTKFTNGLVYKKHEIAKDNFSGRRKDLPRLITPVLDPFSSRLLRERTTNQSFRISTPEQSEIQSSRPKTQAGFYDSCYEIFEIEGKMVD